jgi:hypothetical protein
MDPNLSHMNTIQILTMYSFKIHFTINVQPELVFSLRIFRKINVLLVTAKEQPMKSNGNTFVTVTISEKAVPYWE